MPYGSVMDHGTMFVGFSADQQRLSRMPPAAPPGTAAEIRRTAAIRCEIVRIVVRTRGDII